MQPDSSTESQREYFRQYAQKNKEKIAAYQAEYRAKNAAKLHEYNVKRYAENKERYSIKKKAYYKKNAEHLKAKALEAYRRDPAASNARVAKFAKLNPDKLKAWGAAWTKANPEKKRAACKRFRQKYPEYNKQRLKEWNLKNADRVKAYYQANKEVMAERGARYKREHLEVARLSQSKRRARMLGAGGSHTENDVLVIYDQQSGYCAGCESPLNDKYEVDHIMPIFLGGSDNAENLQLLCMPCNRSKGYKHPDEWRKELEIKKAA